MDCDDPNKELGNIQKEKDTPIISLHVLTGTTGYHNMRVHEKIKNQLVNILVNTGSTYNFMKLQSVQSFIVIIDNEDKLRAQQRCLGLSWEVQGL